MEYTVEEAQKIFEQLIDHALAGKEVIIVETIRCRLVPYKPKGRKARSHQNGARKTRKGPLDSK